MTSIINSYEHGQPLAECPNNASLSRLGLEGTGGAPFMGSEALGVSFFSSRSKPPSCSIDGLACEVKRPFLALKRVWFPFNLISIISVPNHDH